MSNSNTKPHRTALLAGASGQVGGFLLAQLLACTEYDKVISVGRRKTGISHPKLEEIIIDFEKPETLNIPADDVYCCLGTTIKKAGSQEQFKKVDYGYPVALATHTLAAGASSFMIVSSMGTDINSRIFYSRVKGEMEAVISQMAFQKMGIFRPSMLFGPRSEFRLGELMGKALMQAFAWIIPIKYKGVQASQVAKAMLHFALSDKTGVHIVENPEILNS